MTTDPDALLPPYDGITLADVRMVKSDQDAAAALAALSSTDVLGFDTESKPTFLKGEQSTGPHLVQLATDEVAYLFQIGATPALGVLKAVLESKTILKVGFGLKDDILRLQSKLGIQTHNVLDLSNALRKGERNSLGAKTAVARFFGQKLQKSKKITTTNWSLPRLSDKQILYAADDAHVALRVYRRWRCDQAKPAP
ncbi:3'-5' exonuclease domain-containing protein 2 [Massilia sp. P8910]|uniref:3'-5' exonuclease n=1 Tax=Massilia antarctica TaxID=2765360 RepID=UPI0006BB89B9|nr:MULTISPECIES: 3'-5' exonuclease [Massilia]MCE3607018.1 3'-5' exonuclease domain-containing protein 2 [Massilia antarctica]MCY0912826.1 3'-5' exonuclease domain-containing protein 2 [Massilia sp. H27-R4]CUI03964.1 3'-5' exonuclease domain protein [Janthinobacterium sp. CG23_2]CUU27750.1 3'-5' exonuclease domain protein [Janthinobacterium sp. CG23_2]